MAVRQMSDYLLYGNILNSVNYPDIELPQGVGGCRLCVAYKNIPNVLSGISSLMGKAGINIENMVSKSKNEFSYTLLDLSSLIDDKTAEELKTVEGVIKIRILK
jgi:D-3-phosphoglycerate dehydrogenase